MTTWRTDRVLTCFRIGDPNGDHRIYSSDGARLFPGRWNTPSSPIIYASERYSTAMQEKLVQANAILPANLNYIRITVPNGVSYGLFQTARHPGWDARDEMICNSFGEAWYREQCSALLLVPSIPARLERNILINPLHPDTAAITHELPEPVWWDERLNG